MRASAVLVLLLTCASCGRIGFDAQDVGVGDTGGTGDAGDTSVVDSFPVDAPSIDQVELTALDGTTVPAGAFARIGAAILPADAQVPGRVFTLQVTGALFVSAERSTETLEVAVTADGTIPRFMLRFDLDATPPAMATISAATGDLEVIGDTTYSVTAPALESIDDLAGVRAPAGFGVRVMPNEGPEDLTDRATALAFPPFDGWPTGPYVGLSGDTPTVARFDGTGFETFAVSDGINGPDRNVSRLQFGPPDGSYGPFLFVCSASFGDGDGVFSVSSAGDFAIWYDFNNCNGITFDRTGVAGDPGFLPAMYLNRNSDNMVRVDRMATPTTLTTGLSWGGSGHRLYAAEHPAFPTGLWLLFLGTDPSYDDGYLWNATVADPWPTAPEVLLPVLNGPRAVVLSDAVPWGDLVLILLGGTGELRAYRPDWTSFVVMDGITGGSDAVMGPDERVYIVERSLGRVLVLRPRRGA